MMGKYVRANESGLFDKVQRLEELQAMGDPLSRLDGVIDRKAALPLAQIGDPLSRLDGVIDWRVFEPVFARIPRAEPRGPGGRPGCPPLMMFKAIVLASLSQLSDQQLEFQPTDRLSFKRFLGLSAADAAPEEKTFWAFREMLTTHELVGPLFAIFHAALEAKGMFARKGQMVAATFVEVPRQRNTREEKAKIKAGEVPAGWEEQPQKARQKDVDARWTRKNDERHCGYKNHVKVDSRRKLIEDDTVTPASVPDSQVLAELIAEGDPTTSVDSAYTGEKCEKIFLDRKVGATPSERGYRNKPRNGSPPRSNRARSRVRARVEQVFATMRMSLRRAWPRCLGLRRNRAAIALTNLVYNMVRFAQIARLGLKNWRVASLG